MLYWGSRNNWWLRSVDSGNSTNAANVNNNGNANNNAASNANTEKILTKASETWIYYFSRCFIQSLGRKEGLLMDEEKMAIQGEINALKQLLANTDYKALKYAEGQISDDEYEKVKESRQTWRDKINELEAQLDD